MRTANILLKANLVLTLIFFLLFAADQMGRVAYPNIRSLIDMPLSVSAIAYLFLTPLLTVGTLLLDRKSAGIRRTSYFLIAAWGIAIAFLVITATRIHS